MARPNNPSWWYVFLLVHSTLLTVGCSPHAPDTVSSTHEEHFSDTRSLISLGLDTDAENALNAVMREHLEAVMQIVEALGKEDFQAAQDVTEHQLGMAKHREAMRRQMPENFPPHYHDLAMAHHHAADALATTIPSKSLPRILQALANTLDACVACHRVYRR